MISEVNVKQANGLIVESFQLIREGNFEKALNKADQAVSIDRENFWAWYLGAVALGFLKDFEQYREYVKRAGKLHEVSPFFHYLKAYGNVLDGDMEKALWEWTRIVDFEEGWLARELIEDARKGKNILVWAAKGEFAKFIVLPDFLNDLPKEPDNQHQKVKKNQHLYKRKRAPIQIPLKLVTVLTLFIAVVSLGVYYLWYYEPQNNSNKSSQGTLQGSSWETLKIEDWANVLLHKTGKNILYKYKSRDDLLNDFESAKKLLTNKKINQTRFLLQRILHSNADFKTKEKSRIFLKFIPEPDHEEFKDPISPKQVLEFPDYYVNSIVLWEGQVLTFKEVEQGRQLRLSIPDTEKEYSVEAFYHTGKTENKWEPYEKFSEKKEAILEKKAQAVIYGKFKGLVGKQKKIYVEIIRLWL